MSSQQFYQNLDSFTDFAEIAQGEHFRPVPDDWHVFMTDVVGSTKAIEAGRYKDVNTIGAASISTVINALDAEFPYVFGGDGATMVVPAHAYHTVANVLAGLAVLSQQQFGLDLRVGSMPVSAVIAAGFSIEVAKYALVSDRCVAVFRGGGLSYAEREMKSRPASYRCIATSDVAAGLTGLSCRWNKIPNQRGCVLSLLVVSRPRNSSGTYQRFLAFLNTLFDGKLSEANPVNTDQMTYKSVSACVQDERRFEKRRFSLSYVKRMAEIAASVLVFRWRWKPLIFNSRKYQASMRLHADYRKFDDMLRMVIDCSLPQADAIRAYLGAGFTDGTLYFGMHVSDSSLMTCFVEGLGDGQHIHFVDGDNGGYAMAAKELKAQFEQVQSRSHRRAVQAAT